MNKNLKRFAALFLALSMLFVLSACGGGNTGSSGSQTSAPSGSGDSGSSNSGSGETITLKMANQHPSDSIGNQLDQEMCQRIEEATDGRIKIELYSDSALGDYTNVFDELMVGSIDMAHISPVETYDSRVSATMLPYLAFSYDDLLKVYAEDGFLFSELNDALNNLGIHLSGIFCEGFNGIGTMQEVTDAALPKAEKGVIIRSPMMDVYSLCFQDMGFRVSSMPYSDTYTAMQTGVVSGLGGGTAQINYMTFRDLIKAFYDYRYIQEATMILFSQKTWDTISAEDQEAISAVIKETCEKAVTMAETANDEYMDKMEAEGIKVVKFSDEELSNFANSCRDNVWPQLAKNYPDGWLDTVRESLT